MAHRRAQVVHDELRQDPELEDHCRGRVLRPVAGAMTIPSAPLNILTFPQRWNGPANTLDLNVLVLPKGDPAAGFVPAFPDATLTLNAHVVSGLDALPVAVPPAKGLAIDQDPADRRAFFDELLRVLNL